MCEWIDRHRESTMGRDSPTSFLRTPKRGTESASRTASPSPPLAYNTTLHRAILPKTIQVMPVGMPRWDVRSAARRESHPPSTLRVILCTRRANIAVCLKMRIYSYQKEGCQDSMRRASLRCSSGQSMIANRDILEWGGKALFGGRYPVGTFVTFGAIVS